MRSDSDVRWWHLHYNDDGTLSHGPSGTTGPLVELLGAISNVYTATARS
jgi:hypothetical protein